MRNRPQDLNVEPYQVTSKRMIPGPPSLSGKADKYTARYSASGVDDTGIVQQDQQQEYQLPQIAPLSTTSIQFNSTQRQLPKSSPSLLHYSLFDDDESREESKKSIQPPGILGRTIRRNVNEAVRDPPPVAPSSFVPCGSLGGPTTPGPSMTFFAASAVNFPVSPTPYGFVCTVLDHQVDRLPEEPECKAIHSGEDPIAPVPDHEVKQANQKPSNLTTKHIEAISTRIQRTKDSTKTIQAERTPASTKNTIPSGEKRQILPKKSKQPTQTIKNKKPDPQAGESIAARNVLIDYPTRLVAEGDRSGVLPDAKNTLPPKKSSKSKPKERSKPEENIFDTSNPTPRSSGSREAKEYNEQLQLVGTHPGVRRDNLWDATRLQRYDQFIGRVKPSLSRSMKMSPSMNVEASSTTGSTFSFNSILDDGMPAHGSNSGDRSHMSVEDDFTRLSTSISYVSQPGFLPPADPSHHDSLSDSMEARESGRESSIREAAEDLKSTDETYQMSRSSTPPSKMNHLRSEFWAPPSETTLSHGVRSKSTAENEGRMVHPVDVEADPGETKMKVSEDVEEREPTPEDIPLTPMEERLVNMDRIESTREVSSEDDDQQVSQTLAIPSLYSQRSSQTSLENVQKSLAMKVTKKVPISGYHPPLRLVESHHKDHELSATVASTTPVATRNETGDLATMVSSRSLPSTKPGILPRVDVQGQPSVQVYRRPVPSPMMPSLDQRTVRMLYADEFEEMIKVHSSEHVAKFLQGNISEKKNTTLARSGVSFVVRKRPLLNSESERGEFDVIDTPVGHPDAVVLYEATICSDRKTRDLKAHLFRFDGVFSDEVSSEEFYIRCGQTPVLTAIDGGYGTIITFGNSGSGKSHTIADFEERAAFDIFADASNNVPSVSVKYLELYGNQIIDLLGPIGSFARVVQNDGVGEYHVKGAIAAAVSSADELLLTMSNAKRRFVTQSLVRRHNECHSFLLCQILIDTGDNVGQLSLLECPSGANKQYSETDVDMKEVAPFACLMENIRGKVSGQPRQEKLLGACNLAKLMKQALTAERSNICLVASVSPNATTTEDTLETLLSLKKIMNGYPKSTNKFWNPSQHSNDVTIADEDLALPRQWSKDQLLTWMSAKKLIPNSIALRQLSQQEGLSGRFVMRMTKSQLKTSFYNEVEDGEKMAQRLFIALRAENDRVARLRVKRKLALEKEQK